MIEVLDDVVRLRPMDLTDVQAHLAGEDASTVRYLSGGSSTVATVTAWIERNRESWSTLGPIRSFGVRELATDHLIGMIEANLAMPGVRAGVANISYGLYPPFRGKGYATRAVRLMVQYLNAYTTSDRALIQVEPANEPSTRVAMRSGFQFIGQRISADGDLLSMFVLPVHTADAHGH